MLICKWCGQEAAKTRDFGYWCADCRCDDLRDTEDGPKVGDSLVTSFGEFRIVKVTSEGLVSIYLGGDDPVTLDYFAAELRWHQNPGCWVVK